MHINSIRGIIRRKLEQTSHRTSGRHGSAWQAAHRLSSSSSAKEEVTS